MKGGDQIMLKGKSPEQLTPEREEIYAPITAEDKKELFARLLREHPEYLDYMYQLLSQPA